VDVVTTKSRKERIHAAKEQIASICQEIVGDPEDGVRCFCFTRIIIIQPPLLQLPLLRRLHNFSLETIVSPTQSQPVPNDPTIRKLAILSQVAVFKDIIPGYRIRSLTEQEKSEKVGQAVARLREWEQGLVGVYQKFLQLLESEIKGRAFDF
jgi:nucleolar complex protein 3